MAEYSITKLRDAERSGDASSPKCPMHARERKNIGSCSCIFDPTESVAVADVSGKVMCLHPEVGLALTNMICLLPGLWQCS